MAVTAQCLGGQAVAGFGLTSPRPTVHANQRCGKFRHPQQLIHLVGPSAAGRRSKLSSSKPNGSPLSNNCCGEFLGRLRHGSIRLRSSFLGQQWGTNDGEGLSARRSLRTGTNSSASEPKVHFTDEPSSYLPGLFDGHLVDWLPDSVIAEATQIAAAAAAPSGSPDGESLTEDSGPTATGASYAADEHSLPLEIRLPTTSGGPVPVMVQLSAETRELFQAQAKSRPSVFVYLLSLLTKGASSVLLLGGSAVISVVVSMVVLERAGVMRRPTPTYMVGAPGGAEGMPRVVIRKTVVKPPPEGRDEAREDEVDSTARPISVAQLPEGWTQERFAKLGKDLRAADKFWNRLRTKWWKLPAEWLDAIEREVERLSRMHPMSTEQAFVMRYLDWMTLMPWGEVTTERFNVAEARKVLEEDHFALDEVKERLLEFIAVSQLKGTTQGRIILLHGPPGVGKTSIAKSMARALNRKFHRLSVGGLNDPVEFKGHNRTYVGSEPGKVVGALKQVGVMNPLILLDEVDKMAHTNYRGDPGAALLEILDPEQNSAFKDHYMEVGLDLSQVLFVCTANDIGQIARPLLDRMETIELSGYSTKEKVHIAKRFLLPKIKDKVGLAQDQVEITEPVLEAIATKYTFEAGCRGLERQLEKICRKIALELVDSRQAKAPQEQPSAAASPADVSSPQPSAGVPDSPPPLGAQQRAQPTLGNETRIFVKAARGEAGPPADCGDSDALVGVLGERQPGGSEAMDHPRILSGLEAGTSGSSGLGASDEWGQWRLERSSGSDAKVSSAGRDVGKKEGSAQRGGGAKGASALKEGVGTLLDRLRAQGAMGAPKEKEEGGAKTRWQPWKQSGESGSSRKEEGGVDGRGVLQRGASRPGELLRSSGVYGSATGSASQQVAGGSVGVAEKLVHRTQNIEPAEARVGLAVEKQDGNTEASLAARLRLVEYHLGQMQAAVDATRALEPAPSDVGSRMAALLEGADLADGMDAREREMLEAVMVQAMEEQGGEGETGEEEEEGMTLEEMEVPEVTSSKWPSVRARLSYTHHWRRVQQLALEQDDPALMRALRERHPDLALLCREAMAGQHPGGEDMQLGVPVWAREKAEGIRGEWAALRGSARHQVEAVLGAVEYLLLSARAPVMERPPAFQAALDGLKAVVDRQEWARAAAEGTDFGASVLRRHAGSGFPVVNGEGVVLVRTWWRALERCWEKGTAEARGAGLEGGPQDGVTGGPTTVPAAVWEDLSAPPAVEWCVAQAGGVDDRWLDARGREVQSALLPALHVLTKLVTEQRPFEEAVLVSAREAVGRAGAYAASVDSGVLESEVLMAQWLLDEVEAPVVAAFDRFEEALAPVVARADGQEGGEVSAAFVGFQEGLAALGLKDDWTRLERSGSGDAPLSLGFNFRSLVELHSAAVLYHAESGALEGLSYPRLTRQQGDAWNMACVRHMVRQCARDLTQLAEGTGAKFVEWDGGHPEGYNVQWPTTAGLTTQETAALRGMVWTRHWLGVLEGPLQDWLGWRTGAALAAVDEGARALHACLLTDLRQKRIRHAPLFDKLVAQGCQWAEEVDARVGQDAGRVLGFEGRTALEWALESRETLVDWVHSKGGPELLLLYEEPAVLRHLQGDPAPSQEASGVAQKTTAAPLDVDHLRLKALSAKLLGGGSGRSKETLVSLVEEHKRVAHARAQAEFAAVRKGARSARAVLRLRLGLLHSAHASFLADSLTGQRVEGTPFDLRQATVDALGEEPPLRSNGQRWQLGDPLEELFPLALLPTADEVDMDLVQAATASFDGWRLFGPDNGWKSQTEESAQTAAGFLEALLHMTTERAVRTPGPSPDLSSALAALHEKLERSFARPHVKKLPDVVERVAGLPQGKGGLLGGATRSKAGALEGAQGAVLLRACRSTLLAPLRNHKDLEARRLTMQQAADTFVDAREYVSLRRVLFEGADEALPLSLFLCGDGGMLAPLIGQGPPRTANDPLPRGINTDDVRVNAHVEAELYELLWAYLRERGGSPEWAIGKRRQGGVQRWGQTAAAAICRQLGLNPSPLENPHAAPFDNLSQVDGPHSTPLQSCRRLRVDLPPTEDLVAESATKDAQAHPEASTLTERAPGSDGGRHRDAGSTGEGSRVRGDETRPTSLAPREDTHSAGVMTSSSAASDGEAGSIAAAVAAARRRTAEYTVPPTSAAPPTLPAGALGAVAERPAVVVAADKFVVGMDNLRQYLGRPKWGKERWYADTPVGVVMGLVTTQAGGQIAYIEASLISRNSGGSREGSILATGQMGDVLKESTTIAHSVAARVLQQKAPGSTFFEGAKIHVHMPEGSTPKDGPSAGVTLTASLLSLALDRPVRPNLSMTGEITLVGRVLPVGGIKEKVSAAQRAGVKTLILPSECRHAWEELAEDVTEGMEVHFAETIEDVVRVAFADSDTDKKGEADTGEAGMQPPEAAITV